MHTKDEFTFPSNCYERQNWLVMKFGGTSVTSAGQWANIRDLVRERQLAGFRLVVVHSALATVSNRLAEALDGAVQGRYELQLDEIVAIHTDLRASLGVEGSDGIDEFSAELEQLLAGIKRKGNTGPRSEARVLSLGELMATRIGAAYLRSEGIDVTWIDARDALQSIDLPLENERSHFLSANCSSDSDKSLQNWFEEVPGVILTQGFIARDPEGETVLLGLEGSDTSAAYFAAKLEARGLEIWTDVPGLFSADPRIVSGARLLNALSYGEAQEIASNGGTVLHPRCLRPIRKQGIPLRVLCTTQPELGGTLISRDPGKDAPGLKAISSREGITVVSMETLGMWQEVGFLAEAFKRFADLGLSIDLVSTAESNVTVTLDTRQQVIDSTTLNHLRMSLEELCRVEIIEGAEVVSLVGREIRGLLHQIGPALEVFANYRVHLVSQAANDLNLSFVVEQGQALRLLKKLHASLVYPMPNDVVFGPTWDELQARPLLDLASQRPWWVEKRQRLLDIGSAQISAYVYDLETIRKACARLSSLENVKNVFYALKANSHPDVLRTVAAVGLNFECVSPGEVDLVLDLFPDINRRRILFTPSFAPRGEYASALEKGVWVTLDNIYPLREWGEIFAGHEILLRLDTGRGRGHHEHVRTAGALSKFGIPETELDEVRRLAGEFDVRIVGLHAHTGSGITQADNWQLVATALIEVAQSFPDIRLLDLGGGLGVAERPGQQVLDMAGLDASLVALKKSYPQYEFWLEPGRYVVAEAGVLLVSVTQTKRKGGVRYVGVSTGMNSLIRPALYGAHHEIVNLTRLSEASGQVVNVVGPICETGDKLGTDRLLPPCEEGDVLAITNAGAYGYVMSSRYNLRDPAVEQVI